MPGKMHTDNGDKRDDKERITTNIHVACRIVFFLDFLKVSFRFAYYTYINTCSLSVYLYTIVILYIRSHTKTNYTYLYLHRNIMYKGGSFL